MYACILPHTAMLCNTLQTAATHSNTLHHTASHSDVQQRTATQYDALQHTKMLSHTLQVTATRCITLLYTATCNALQRSATQWTHLDFLRRLFMHHECWHYNTLNTLQHTTTQHNTLQRIWNFYDAGPGYMTVCTATHCNTLHHTATHCNTM